MKMPTRAFEPCGMGATRMAISFRAECIFYGSALAEPIKSRKSFIRRDGVMRLTVLGCGTAAPDADRAASGFYLEAGGLAMLMDCGPGVVHHMARFGIDWQHITHLLITHFHNDHIGDVPALFFAWRYGMLPPRTDPLTLIA